MTKASGTVLTDALPRNLFVFIDLPRMKPTDSPAGFLLPGAAGRAAWAYAPYTKPGANLARAVREAMSVGTDVIVLGQSRADRRGGKRR